MRIIENTTPDYSAPWNKVELVIGGISENDGIKEEYNYAEGRWINSADCRYAKSGEGKLELLINRNHHLKSANFFMRSEPGGIPDDIII